MICCAKHILYHTYVLVFSGQLKEGIFGLSLNAFLELVAISIEKYSPIVETHYGKWGASKSLYTHCINQYIGSHSTYVRILYGNEYFKCKPLIFIVTYKRLKYVNMVQLN